MFAIRFPMRQTGAVLASWIYRLEAARAEIYDRSQPFDEIKQRQIKRWETNFDSEGGIYGEWPPLDAWHFDAEEGEWHLGWTGRDRQAMGLDPEGPMLIRTEGTFRSFVEQNENGKVSENAVFWSFRNTGGGVRGGAYPVSHHVGYLTALGTYVPSRVLWDLDEEDEDFADDMLERHVEAVVRRYF